MPVIDPFRSADYLQRRVASACDALLLGLDAAQLRMHDVLVDLTDEEYQWEPLPVSERSADMALPPEKKRVWRVYRREQQWTYDYAGGRLIPPPFTTIAWLANHVVSTADMYWYCIRTGQPAGKTRDWSDIVVPSTRQAMSDSLTAVFSEIRAYLLKFGPK